MLYTVPKIKQLRSYEQKKVSIWSQIISGPLLFSAQQQHVCGMLEQQLEQHRTAASPEQLAETCFHFAEEKNQEWVPAAKPPRRLKFSTGATWSKKLSVPVHSTVAGVRTVRCKPFLSSVILWNALIQVHLSVSLCAQHCCGCPHVRCMG